MHQRSFQRERWQAAWISEVLVVMEKNDQIGEFVTW